MEKLQHFEISKIKISLVQISAHEMSVTVLLSFPADVCFQAGSVSVGG